MLYASKLDGCVMDLEIVVELRYAKVSLAMAWIEQEGRNTKLNEEMERNTEL